MLIKIKYCFDKNLSNRLRIAIGHESYGKNFYCVFFDRDFTFLGRGTGGRNGKREGDRPCHHGPDTGR